MKRYLVFTFNTYEPYGGWNDLHSDHADLNEAKSICRDRCEHCLEHGHVVDSLTGKMVWTVMFDMVGNLVELPVGEA